MSAVNVNVHLNDSDEHVEVDAYRLSPMDDEAVGTIVLSLGEDASVFLTDVQAIEICAALGAVVREGAEL